MDFATIKRHVLVDGRFGRSPSPAELAAQSACMDLLHSSFAVIDFGQATRCVPLYAPGASSLIDGQASPYSTIRERYAAREANKARRTRHLVTNFAIRLSDENTAWSISLVTIFLEDDTKKPGTVAQTVADCGDQYTRTPDGWRIAFRYLQPVAGAPR
jgi:hypothetical protein